MGSKVGDVVGALEGELLGMGVVAPDLKVGSRVGDVVGALDGKLLGTGVVAPDL